LVIKLAGMYASATEVLSIWTTSEKTTLYCTSRKSRKTARCR